MTTTTMTKITMTTIRTNHLLNQLFSISQRFPNLIIVTEVQASDSQQLIHSLISIIFIFISVSKQVSKLYLFRAKCNTTLFVAAEKGQCNNATVYLSSNNAIV